MSDHSVALVWNSRVIHMLLSFTSHSQRWWSHTFTAGRILTFITFLSSWLSSRCGLPVSWLSQLLTPLHNTFIRNIFPKHQSEKAFPMMSQCFRFRPNFASKFCKSPTAGSLLIFLLLQSHSFLMGAQETAKVGYLLFLSRRAATEMDPTRTTFLSYFACWNTACPLRLISKDISIRYTLISPNRYTFCFWTPTMCYSFGTHQNRKVDFYFHIS